MKPFPWKCVHCGESTLSPKTLPIYECEAEHDGRKYLIAIADFKVLKCSHCGETAFDDAANIRVSDALRAKVGLLSPDEIRSRREKLGLTQKQLGHHLQISDSTLSRWESGVQIQQRCMDRYLRCFFEVSPMRDFLLAVREPSREASLESLSKT